MGGWAWVGNDLATQLPANVGGEWPNAGMQGSCGLACGGMCDVQCGLRVVFLMGEDGDRG